MKLRSVVISGLVCVASPAVASASSVALDHSFDARDGRSIAGVGAAGLGQSFAFDAGWRSGASLVMSYAADGSEASETFRLAEGTKHGHWDESGNPYEQFYQGSSGDRGTGSDNPPVMSTPIRTTVTVAEPATLGLMGFGLLMLVGVTRRLNTGRRLSRLIGPRQ